MRRVGWIVLVLAAAGCAASARPAAPEPSPLERAGGRITPDALAGPIRFLSSDGLEGRGPGTRGDRLARDYIVSEMRAIGLQPGGPDGDWEQRVELIGLTTELPAHWQLAGAHERMHLNRVQDFVATTGVTAEHAGFDRAELVFVGYGIQAPEQSWDDFKGVDLRGKVLLMLNNDPDWDPQLFAGTRRLYYGRWTYKYESAARQGAAGAIIIHTTESAAYPWHTVQSSWTGENARLPAADAPALPVRAWVTEEAAQRVVALGRHSLDSLQQAARSRDFAPIPLGVTTSLRLSNAVRRFETANVIGVLPGTDPVLREQAVIYTAHHDHLGVKRDTRGDAVIYNGALDNASGIAQLLAVARAFAAAPPPRRTIVFIAVAAEEQGLLGSEYYVAHPTVPVAKMVADINFDGASIWGRTRDVAVTGFGRSTLDRWTAAAATGQGRTLADERFPERGGFYRSDQFNFARAGVPVLYARGGLEVIGRPPDWGREQADAWLAAHYHQPTDDFDATWNFDGMVDDARLAFEVGYGLAQTDEMPAWTPGDEFEAARLRALASQ